MAKTATGRSLMAMIQRIGGACFGSLPNAVAAGDDVEAYFDTNGRLHVVSESAGTSTIVGNGAYAAAQTDVELIALVTGKAIHVVDLIITNDATAPVTVKLETDTASAKTALTPPYRIAASNSLVIRFDAGGLVGAVGKNIGVTSVGASNITVQVVGYAL